MGKGQKQVIAKAASIYHNCVIVLKELNKLGVNYFSEEVVVFGVNSSKSNRI